MAAGREAQPTAAIVDSQTVKATEAPAPRDYDANKKLTGLKRHALVDVDGRFLIIGFSTARLHDSVGGAALLKAAKLQCPFLECKRAAEAVQPKSLKFQGIRASISLLGQRLAMRSNVSLAQA